MLDAGDEQPVARRLAAADSSAGVSASMWLRCTAGKGDILGIGADQGSYLRARVLDQPAYGAAFAMYRGGIAGQTERSHHGGMRRLPQRAVAFQSK